MAYGFQILTQTGMVDIFNIPAFQLLHRSSYTMSRLEQRSVDLTLNWRSLTAPCTFILTCSCADNDLLTAMASTNTSPTSRPTTLPVLLGLRDTVIAPSYPPNSLVTVEVWGIKV